MASFFTKYVGKYGIARSCDICPSFLQSDVESIDEADYEKVDMYSTVYVQASALKVWFKAVYPVLKSKSLKIILVTGDAVVSAPLAAIGLSNPIEIDVIRRDGVILHWFAQNCDLPGNPFITPIPLGIDFHSMHARPIWGEQKTSYLEQDQLLDRLGCRGRDNWEKKSYKIVCDAHLTAATNFVDRSAAFSHFKDLPSVLLLPTQLPRSDFWRLIVSSKFIVSPLGAGFDCHRTWEALILGAVPIIRKTTISPVFDGLPVLQVNQYSDVTAESLQSYAYPPHIKEYRLTLGYWIGKIASMQDSFRNALTCTWA